MMDVQQSPRSKRAGYDTVFGISGSNGALKMISKISPNDVTINQHVNWYIGPAEIYQFVRGQNNDGIVATVCAAQRLMFATSQSFGSTVVYHLDSTPALTCSAGSDVSCRKGIATDSTSVYHLYGDDPSSLYDGWSNTFSGTDKCDSNYYVEAAAQPGISFKNMITHDFNDGNPVSAGSNMTLLLSRIPEYMPSASLVEVGGRVGVKYEKDVLRVSKDGLHIWDTLVENNGGSQLRRLNMFEGHKLSYVSRGSRGVSVVNYIDGTLYHKEEMKARGVTKEGNNLVVALVDGGLEVVKDVDKMTTPIRPSPHEVNPDQAVGCEASQVLTVHTKDSYGDGWQGGRMTLTFGTSSLKLLGPDTEEKTYRFCTTSCFSLAFDVLGEYPSEISADVQFGSVFNGTVTENKPVLTNC
jgi:hypothetical protein